MLPAVDRPSAIQSSLPRCEILFRNTTLSLGTEHLHSPKRKSSAIELRCWWRRSRRLGRASRRSIDDHSRSAIAGDKIRVSTPKQIHHWVDLVTKDFTDCSKSRRERL